MIGFIKKSMAVAGLTFAMCASAAATPVFSVPSPIAYRNNSWSFGEIFTVGDKDISVTALGAFDAGLDGFVSTGGIPVGIFRESDGALLASAFVQSGDTLIDNFRYTDITPLTLLAGTSYRVVAVNLDDPYNSSRDFDIDPAITRSGYGYCLTSVLTSCDVYTGADYLWMANFLFEFADTSSGPATVSAPGVLAPFGFGLAGLGMAFRRRKQG
jgi:hypothetical protein